MVSLRKDDRTGRFYFQYYDASGRRRTHRTRTGDSRVAKQIRDKVLGDVAKRRSGLTDAAGEQVEAAERTPLADHVEAYLAACEAQAMSPRHRSQKKKRVETAVAFLGADRLSDLTPDGVERFLNHLRAKQKGARTRNTYRADLVAFGRWCVDTGRLVANGLQRVAKAKEQEDRRRTYRAFEAKELDKVLIVARAADKKNKHPRIGARYPLYVTAALTALRHGELKALEWRDVDLDGAMLTVRPEVSKAGREDVIPLHPQVVEALGEIRPAPVFPRSRVFPRMTTYRTFLADLATAKVKRDDDTGSELTFHSFRVTTATVLARLGVPPQVAMKVLRHRDVQTTVQHYTRLRIEDAADAVGKLPYLGVQPESGAIAVGEGPGSNGVPSNDGKLAEVAVTGGTQGSAEARGATSEAGGKVAAAGTCGSSRKEELERVIGLEPTTFSLGSWVRFRRMLEQLLA